MKENYDNYLADAKATLAKIGCLTDEDRLIIEKGICFLQNGRHLLESDDPQTLRQGAELLMSGAYYLGGHCVVSDSEREFHRRKNCSKGGRGENLKEKGLAIRKGVDAWHEYARKEEAENPKKSLARIARTLLDRPPGCPNTMPSHNRTIEDFLSKCRKELLSRENQPVRLVHSNMSPRIKST
jgi:hypothetical protein